MHIYYVCDGQDDNIGDIILRRRLLERLQELGNVRLCVNHVSDGFLEALGMRPSDTTFRSFKRFLLSILSACRRRERVLFVFNPGEIQCTGKETLISVVLCPLLWLVRARGGAVVRVGGGLRDWHPLWGPVMKATADIADLTYWRDARTSDQFGTGRSAPDWAFDLRPLDPPATDGLPLPERRVLAVSLRSDRPDPSASWCDAVLVASARLNLVPVVVSQVRRDDRSSARLAERLGCDSLLWGTRSHLEQERLVRGVYAEAAGVISDRLHALALGCVEGAAPVGAFESTDVKIGRHFDNAHIHDMSADVRGWSTGRISDFIVDRLGRADAARDGLTSARSELQRIDAEIGALVTARTAGAQAGAA